ncbi:5963_t:CDS:2 [Funneliformis caledonium]|uniref:5963_t:CDS:1 n=1 Tax=Funneliformis caledonium TaxID=1117310 RepID=A0A9N9GHN9_9GLOM|nr:5963_t:CDS:2 [Funneliformis caledonium]
MGNPSDGYNGKCISLLISNFFVELTLTPNSYDNKAVEYKKINFRSPSSNKDCNLSFDSIDTLIEISKNKGYDESNRLLQATCKVFSEYCWKNDILLNQQGFFVHFITNIPRQVGLAGSSAIISAFWKALMLFFDVSNKIIPLPIQANLILSVERDELNISAGLQDRVIQVYGGLIFMDFDEDHMMKHGVGMYERLDVNLLPKGFWIAFESNPSESDKIHNDVRKRYEAGDRKVIDAMKRFASFAEQSRQILIQNNRSKRNELAKYMNKNFDLRREIFGDQVLGQMNLRMIELAREYNFAAKFTGSGEKEGFLFCWLNPKNEVL